ncbi:hypothetical protein ACFL3V_06190 [Nanoarchaeota archaeon]
MVAKKRKKGAKHKSPVKKKSLKRKPRVASKARERADLMHEVEIEGRDLFAPKDKTFGSWLRRYSPVVITILAGLSTYFYLIFNVFYPVEGMFAYVVQVIMILMFVLLLGGVMVYLGIKSETLFIRILSFIFVFVIFTFMIFFILISHSSGMVR